MKISVDGEEIFTLNETQKKVIKNDIHEDIFEEDMKRRIKFILEHKYQKCFERLKAEWEPKLKNQGASIPDDPTEFAHLVFSLPTYKDRKSREAS